MTEQKSYNSNLTSRGIGKISIGILVFIVLITAILTFINARQYFEDIENYEKQKTQTMQKPHAKNLFIHK